MVRLTVIIPTRDRAADLGRCLDGLAACQQRLAMLTLPGGARLHEVIIIDDASDTTAATAPARASDLPVTLLRNDTRIGAGASRRIAVAEATGDVLAFLDDDAVPRGDWLTVASTVDDERPAMTGRVLRFDAGIVSQARQARYDVRYASLATGAPVDFFAGGNSAVLTSVFREVGGFAQEGTGGDNSLARSLAGRGTPVRFAPDLVIAHRNGKGGRQAVRDAWTSGRHHPARMSLAELVAAARSSAVGTSAGVREVNRVLGLVHATARFAPRRNDD